MDHNDMYELIKPRERAVEPTHGDRRVLHGEEQLYNTHTREWQSTADWAVDMEERRSWGFTS